MIDLAISPDGEHLAVADGSTGQLAMIDTNTLAVTDTAAIEPLQREARPALVVIDDRSVLFSTGWSIVAVDGATLTATEAWWYDQRTLWPDPILDLDLSPDGSELRLALPDRIVVVDRTSWAATATLAVPGGGDLGFVGPPAGSLVSAPVECAC
jgi:hypothetical protein